MKHLILFFLLALALSGCEKNAIEDFKIDPSATINIHAANGVKLRSATIDTAHLTALEIVRQTTLLRFTLSNGKVASRGFAPLQRDTISNVPMLKMWGTDIMYYDQLTDGTYTTNLILALDFLEARNCLLIHNNGGNNDDTIAYIPNTVLRVAEMQIKALFAEKDYEPIYTIFNDAYTFIPVTGAEYRALNQE